MYLKINASGLCQFLCGLWMITAGGLAQAQAEANSAPDESARWQFFTEQAQQPLRVAALSLCLTAPEYARCQRPGELRFDRSETVFVYFEPRGLDFQGDDGTVRTAWRQRLSLRDAAGQEIWSQPKMLDRDMRRERPALDVFGANRLQLEGLPAGQYQLVVTVQDRIASESAEASLDFTVAAAPSDAP